MTSEPHLLRFEVHPRTGRVRYAVSGYGHEIEGIAEAGTTPLYVLLVFLVDYAPHDLQSLPAALIQDGPKLDALLAQIQQKDWYLTLTGYGTNPVRTAKHIYSAVLHLPYRHQTQEGMFEGKGMTCYAALEAAFEAALACPDDEATLARRREHQRELAGKEQR